MLAILLCAGLSTGVCRAQSQQWSQADIALQRPRVQILLNVDVSTIPGQSNQFLITDLTRLLSNSWGEGVALEVRLDSTILPPDQNQQLSSSLAVDSIPGEPADQTIHLQVVSETAAGTWTIHAWRTMTLNDEIVRLPPQKIRNSSFLPRSLAELADLLYCPVLRIEQVEPHQLIGTLAGGEWNFPDASAGALQSDDYLQVILLYSDREGNYVQRQVLPWTYLQVTRRERARITAKIISAFPEPVPRSRRRVDVYAWRCRPPLPVSQLQVAVNAQPQRPHPFQKVLLSRWTPADVTTAEQKSPAFLEFQTDRNGLLSLSTNQIVQSLGAGILKLEILSDQAVVMRLPWLPGISEALRVQVPDDTARLQAELAIDQLETELLKTAAKRATLLAALQKLADDPVPRDPSRLLAEWQRLPARKTFEDQLTTIRITAAEQLNLLQNRTALRQVEKRCQQTLELIQRHLSDEPIEDLKLQFSKQLPASSPQ